MLLLENVTGDAIGDAKKVRGPCSALLEGTIGTASVTILAGRPDATRVVVHTFTTATIAASGRMFEIPLRGILDVSANVNGSGDHTVSVSIFH